MESRVVRRDAVVFWLRSALRSAGAVVVFLVAIGGVLPSQGWVDVSDPYNTPGGTRNAGMCYYSSGGYCLLVDGVNTWKYSAIGWQQVTTASLPGNAVLVEVELASSSISNRAVLAIMYVPTSSSGTVLDFFEWNGAGWDFLVGKSVNPTINLGRLSIASVGGQFYAHFNDSSIPGGAGFVRIDRDPVTGSTSLVYPQTLVSPPAGGILSESRMYADESAHRLFLISGQGPSMWSFDPQASNWMQCFPGYLGHAVSGGQFGPIAAAPGRGLAIGLGVDLPYTTQTIQYGLCDIDLKHFASRPAVRYGYSIAFDEGRQTFVLHGGSGSGPFPAGGLGYADTWELQLGPEASTTSFGSGCPGTGGTTPTIAPLGASAPVAGTTYQISVRGLPWNQSAYLMLGLSNTTYGGASLPIQLGPIGAPGCSLLVGGLELYPVPNIFGLGVWQYRVPNTPGLTFYTQVVCLDPTANSLGLILSNGLESVVGM